MSVQLQEVARIRPPDTFSVTTHVCIRIKQYQQVLFDNVVLLFHIKDSMWVWESIYDDDSSVQHSFKWYLSEHFRD